MQLLRILLLTFLPTVLSAGERPNVVFILADDLGIGDVNCYGGDRCQIETPNIDALAKSGLRFTDAHVSASVCIPTRVGIMTGRYPWRFGKPAAGGAWGFLGLQFPKETFTLGDLFRQVGYQTGYIGKWHLGTNMTTLDGQVQSETNVDYTQPLKIGPPNFGFDHSFILPGSLDMYPYAFVRDNVWQGNVTAQKGWSAFNRIGPAEESFEDHEVLSTFYDEAETFLDRQSAQQPFFLYLALTAPHTPVSPGKAFQGKSTLGVYGDFVMEVDEAVNRVISTLKRKGLHDNTLVIFSSDHGPASYAGNIPKATPGQIRELEKQNHFSAGPHRGYKFSVYEGGLRVPLIARWPGVTPPGSECDELVGLNDLMATFADMTSVELKPEQAADSISFWNLIQRPGEKGDRENLIMQGVGPFVVRDGKWKLCLCPGSGAPGTYGNEPASAAAWKAAVEQTSEPLTWDRLSKAPFVQLFDLSNDLHEDTNLAAQQPERVARMAAMLRQQISDGRSTLGPKLPGSADGHRMNINQRVPEFVRKAIE